MVWRSQISRVCTDALAAHVTLMVESPHAAPLQSHPTGSAQCPVCTAVQVITQQCQGEAFSLQLSVVRCESGFTCLASVQYLIDQSYRRVLQPDFPSMSIIGMECQLYQSTGLDGETFGTKQHSDGTKQKSADMPAAGGRVLRTPDRIPMIQLSPNSTRLQARSQHVVRANNSGSSAALSTYNLGGSTTCRDPPTAPNLRRPGSGSGSMTARGE